MNCYLTFINGRESLNSECFHSVIKIKLEFDFFYFLINKFPCGLLFTKTKNTSVFHPLMNDVQKRKTFLSSNMIHSKKSVALRLFSMVLVCVEICSKSFMVRFSATVTIVCSIVYCK